MRITETFRPLPDERALAIVPQPALRVDGAQWRRRALFSTGRVLSPAVLQHEQWMRAARVGLLMRGLAPGVVTGFELTRSVAARPPAPDPDDPRRIFGPWLEVRAGLGVSRAGEDVWLPHAVRLDTAHVPVSDGSLLAAAAWSDADRVRLRSRPVDTSWTLPSLRAEFPGVVLPHAAVLLARPITVLRDRSDVLAQPCLPEPEERLENNFFDDALRFEWFLWPAVTSPLPPADARLRNRLAWRVFDRHARGDLWPWEQTLALGESIQTDGVPLALAGLDWSPPADPPAAGLAPVTIVFIDRHAVVREGGGRRERSPLVAAQRGAEPLWQAQVLQLAEHWNEMQGDRRAGVTRAELDVTFDRLPPAGVLPRDLVDFESGRQTLFPPAWTIDARPVPEELAEPLMSESASLAPLSLGAAEQLELLVPVPAARWEPDLLRLDEPMSPLFAREIKRLIAERDALGQERDGWRRRLDVFSHAASGQWPVYQDLEPGALADESGVAKGRLFRRVHSGGTAGRAELQAHGFASAQETLQLQAGDRLAVYVRPAPGASPQYLLLQGIARRPDGARTTPSKVFWWGSPGQAAPAVPGVAAGALVFRGTLPATSAAGTWLRLEVDASHLGVDATQPVVTLEGLCYGTIAGSVSWGHAGSVNAGRERFWVGELLPQGADIRATANTIAGSHQGGWPWQAPQGAAVAVDGWLEDGDRRLLSDIQALLERAERNVALAELQQVVLDPNAAGGVKPPPNNRVLDLGLAPIIETLDAKGRESNDLVEFGFLRTRVDLYRLRARLLGQQEGDRLLASPAVAELVKRSETTYATEQLLTEFLGKAGSSVVRPAPTPAPAAVPTPAPGPRSTRSAAGSARPQPAGVDVQARVSSRLFERVPAAPLAAPTLGPVLGDRPVLGARPVLGDRPLLRPGVGPGLGRGSVLVPAPPPPKVQDGASATAPPPTVDDVIKSGTYTVSQNQATIAERLSGVPVIEAWHAAAQGKLDGVQRSASRLFALGVAVDDVPVFGFVTGADNKRVATVKEFRAAGNQVRDIDADDTTLRTEADYFTHGLNALDNGLRFWRGVESVVEQYRQLRSLCESTLQRLQLLQQRCNEEIAALERRLAEVRHDLGVALALEAEERRRIAALLARRRAVLTEVRYLVYRRPRLANRFDDVPVRTVETGRFVSPVPACRAGTHAVPAEIERMVQAMRNLPVRLFPPLLGVLGGITDRTELFDLLARAPGLALARQALPVEAAPPDAPVSAQAMVHVQGSVLQLAQQHALGVQALDTAALLHAPWTELAATAPQVLTAADLIGGRRTLQTSGELDDIARVAACLHRSMQGVPPALRLRWATLLSVFDRPPMLRDLSALPGFGSTGQGLDFADWKAMQSMVDWLFSRIDGSSTEALNLVNDLVRITILLASHAPVKQLIPARLLQPVRPLVGTLVHLGVDLSANVMVGMRVDFARQAPTLSAAAPALALAVVEDVAPGLVVARVVEAAHDADLVTESTVVQVHAQATQAMTQYAGAGLSAPWRAA